MRFWIQQSWLKKTKSEAITVDKNGYYSLKISRLIEIHRTIKEIIELRTVASMSSNDLSSRGHLIIKLKIRNTTDRQKEIQGAYNLLWM